MKRRSDVILIVEQKKFYNIKKQKKSIKPSLVTLGPQRISFTFSEMNIQREYDFVRIYEGDSTDSKFIEILTGGYDHYHTSLQVTQCSFIKMSLISTEIGLSSQQSMRKIVDQFFEQWHSEVLLLKIQGHTLETEQGPGEEVPT